MSNDDKIRCEFYQEQLSLKLEHEGINSCDYSISDVIPQCYALSYTPICTCKGDRTKCDFSIMIRNTN